MREATTAPSPVWTQGRIIELVAMLCPVALEAIFFLVMILTEVGTSWGAMGITAILVLFFAPLQLAWGIWFLIRFTKAGNRRTT